MKTRSLFTPLVALGSITAVVAQTPVIQKQPVITTQVIKGNTPVINLHSGTTTYDPSARVKYIFLDEAAFTPVTSRSLPEANDYISLYTVINGQEYTVVPADDLNVSSTASGMHAVALALSSGPRAAGVPSGPAVWRVSGSGSNYTLMYSGAFANIRPEVGTTGGYLGLQSGEVKIAGSAAGITPNWTLQTVSEGSMTYLRLQNSEGKYLGFTYSQGRTVPTMPVVYGNFAAKALTGMTCPAGVQCDTKWYYKIYTGQRTAGRPAYASSLEPGTYMINTSYDNKSLMAFGTASVFGNTNIAMDEMQWRFEPTTRGTYFIFNKKNNMALGINPADNKLAFVSLNIADFSNTDNLQWILAGPSGARYMLRPLIDRNHPSTNVLTCNRAAAGLETPVGGTWQELIITPPNGPLWGYIDMHTHPMSYLGFGTEFFFGAVDGDIATALGNCNCMHNFVTPPFDGSCGGQNLIRNQLLDALDDHTKGPGYPDFVNWPRQSTTTHQQMWWEWIDRARRSGLRMIIALAQNSHTLADGLETKGPYDDLRSMNTQIAELIAFVGRHRGIMDTVTTAARLRNVVQSQRLAVVIGIEMDNIGNFYNPSEKRAGEVYNPMPTEAQVRAEIDRLYAMGVRYVFPVHIVNNVFGGASVYGDDMEPLLFNLSNYYVTGSRFNVEAVSTAATGINFKCPDLNSHLDGGMKVLLDVLRSLPGMPLKADVLDLTRYSYPNPGAGYGHRNVLGLTPLGQMAVKYMMSKGMMIDVDHMSQHAVSKTLAFAMQFNYPVNSGHNGPRGTGGNEKTRTNGQYDTLRVLGGMVGIGTGDAEAGAFVNTFHTVISRMGGRNVALGTDVGVGAKLPHAPSVAARLTGNIPGLDVCHTGNKTWDFNTYNTDGVDHYGMMPEFIRSLDRVGFSAGDRNDLYSSVEYFAQMWEKCEVNKRNVR